MTRSMATAGTACKFALLFGTAAWVTPAYAQTTEPADVQAESAEEDGGENVILVTGTRQSLENALARKREAIGVVDSISAEGIGELPDLNLAESLQRLPGVQINRSAPRRLGTVSIRGLPGDFSQTLINGQYLASPDVSNFSFGTMRSEVFSGIDVVKAATADRTSGGLSGLVNLRTGSPLSAPEMLAVNADVRYETLEQGFAPGASLVWSKKIIPGVLGIRAAVGYQNQNFREDNVQINTYDRIAGAATDDGADDLFAPQQVRLIGSTTEADSYSAALTVEWQPTSDISASLSGFYNRYTPSSYLSLFRFESRANSVRSLIDPPASGGATGSTATHVRIDNPYLAVDSRGIDDTYRTDALTGTVQWTPDLWTVTGTVHYTDARHDNVSTGYNAEINPAASGASNGYSVDVDVGRGDLSQFTYDLLAGNPRTVDLTQPFGNPLPSSFRQVRGLTFPLQSFVGGFRNFSEEESELALQLDIERELDFGFFRSIKVGGVYRDKAQSQVQSLASLFGADLTVLGNDLYNFSFLDNSGAYMGGKLGQFDPGDIAELDARRITALLTPVTPGTLPSNAFIGPEGLVNFLDTTALANTYQNDQRIYGGYAQTTIDSQLGPDVRLNGSLGIRYERSERETVAQNRPDQLEFAFSNWLPSVNLALEFWDDLILRGSYTRTLRRPQVDSFAVLRSVSVDGTGNNVTIDLGASDLRPFTSDNIDVSLEWYNRAGSALTALFFNKNVKDYAATTRVCPADASEFGLGALSTDSGVCRLVAAAAPTDSFPGANAGAVVNINVTANQDSFTLRGFELTAQQNLDFLPAPWNGLGGQINYTYIDFSSSSSFRLSEISNDTVNAIVYYETEAFGVRAAYNFRSRYFLASTGSFSGNDRLVRDRAQLDVTGYININDRLQVTAEGFNLTSQPLYEYQGVESRPRNYSYFGRTFSIGARYRF